MCFYLIGNYWTNQAAWSRYKTGIWVCWQDHTRQPWGLWSLFCSLERLVSLMRCFQSRLLFCICTVLQQTNSVIMSACLILSPIRCLWMLGITSVVAPWSTRTGWYLLLTATSRKHILDIFRPHLFIWWGNTHTSIYFFFLPSSISLSRIEESTTLDSVKATSSAPAPPVPSATPSTTLTPEYSSYNIDNDIVLIKLSKPAILNRYVEPVALPSK